MKTNNKPLLLYVDQYGDKFWACTLKELREQVPGAVSKMYSDTVSGGTNHVGYVIGQHWLIAYAPHVFNREK